MKGDESPPGDDGYESRSTWTTESPLPAEQVPVERSLSVRHMKANGLTPDGNLTRLAIAAEMANTPGWRGRRIIKGLAWLSLLLLGLLVLQAAAGVVLNLN